jgi:hypothetical protein
MKIPDEHMGGLYQLYGRGFNVGDHFPVRGPHDLYGVVMAIKESHTPQGTLYLVRGTKMYKYGSNQ